VKRLQIEPKSKKERNINIPSSSIVVSVYFGSLVEANVRVDSNLLPHIGGPDRGVAQTVPQVDHPATS
jgi:hypothetical protein